jgi:isoamylase
MSERMNLETYPAGEEWPFGATWIESEKAFNFALYSQHAIRVTLLCYRQQDVTTPSFRFEFQHPAHKTGNIWHCRIPLAALNGATLYAYRVDGPHLPQLGHHYDPDKILLDPYAPEVFFPPGFSRRACELPGRTDGVAPLGVLLMPHSARNFRDIPPLLHPADPIVYELHVKGFTANPNSGVTPSKRGTFAGLIEKIPYLQELGITVVELLPIHQFDPQEGNYWGYMTLNFFSPHRQYASGDAFDEFREMAMNAGRPTASGASTTSAIISSHVISDSSSTIPAAGIRFARAIPRDARWCWKACAFGRAKWAWTDFVLTWPPFFPVRATAPCIAGTRR